MTASVQKKRLREEEDEGKKGEIQGGELQKTPVKTPKKSEIPSTPPEAYASKMEAHMKEKEKASFLCQEYDQQQEVAKEDYDREQHDQEEYEQQEEHDQQEEYDQSCR